MNEKTKKAIVYLVGAIATALAMAWGLTSCQVSRIVSTSAESHNRGDTTVIIQTKTTETYTGRKTAPF